MSLSEKEPAKAANVIVRGECVVQTSSESLPIVSRTLYLCSGFVVMELGSGKRRIVSKNFINSIVAGTRSEITAGESYTGSSAFKITQGKVRTVDGREIEGNEVRSEDDFIIIYMPDGHKFIIRKDLVKEVEEILAAADQNRG